MAPSPIPRMFEYKGKATNILEPNLLGISLDLGFRFHHQVYIQLAGIDMHYGSIYDQFDATDFVLALLIDSNFKVEVRTMNPIGKDSWLGFVRLANGNLISDELVAVGYAVRNFQVIE
jgi:hypothetical protein